MALAATQNVPNKMLVGNTEYTLEIGADLFALVASAVREVQFQKSPK